MEKLEIKALKEMKITEFENHTLSLPGEERRAVAPISSPAEKAPAPAAHRK